MNPRCSRAARKLPIFLGTLSLALATIFVTPLAAQAPAGDQRTLVIVANFTDKAVTCSVDSIRLLMFDPSLSVAALYKDNSLGRVTFSGDVIGPYTINKASTDPCSLSALSSAAETSATAAGVDVAAYPRRVYVMPPNSCGSGGYGSAGGVPSSAWIFSCDIEGTYAHNLGHNLGLNHAGTAAPMGDTEFDDAQDPMGWTNHNIRGFNAPHRQQLGWLAGDSVPMISEDGYLNIAPLALDPASALGPQVAMIAKPDTQEFYYLSYRRQIGFDSFIDGGVFDRLSVHRYKGDGSATRTFLLAGLDDGQSYVDTVNGITVTLVSHNTAYATARVQFAATTCVPATPALSVLPQLQTAAPGDSVSYSVSVSNFDAPGCTAATFTLGGVVPAGWSGTVSSASLTLRPGETGLGTLTVTSAANAAAGTYGVTMTASDTARAAHAASAALTYVVQDTLSPSTPANLTATANKQKKQVQLSWGAAEDNVGTAGYRVSRNGVVVGTSTTTSWSDPRWKAGATYTYSVVAYDGAANVSAPSNSVTVNLPGGGNGQ